MSLAILTIIGIVAGIVIWAMVRLARAARLRKRGLDVSAEDRRLRDDPRFTGIWVQQLKNDPPRSPDDPSQT